MALETIVSAPGKVIVSGEHSVVYGYPALVSSLNLYAYSSFVRTKKGLFIYPDSAREIVTKTLGIAQKFLGEDKGGFKIKLDSEIPIGSGMGSSAAVAASVAAGFLKFRTGKIDSNIVQEVVDETEKFYHGNPSGVDAAISIFGGILWYRKETPHFKTFSKIKAKKSFENIFLVNTGRPKENTSQMVNSVSELYKRNPKKVESIFRKIEKVTKGFLSFILGEESPSLSELIMENERYLERLEVVSDSTISLIRKIEDIDGAAKISGAGGKRGNSGILICYHKKPELLLGFLQKKGIEFITPILGVRGVYAKD